MKDKFKVFHAKNIKKMKPKNFLLVRLELQTKDNAFLKVTGPIGFLSYSQFQGRLLLQNQLMK